MATEDTTKDAVTTIAIGDAVVIIVIEDTDTIVIKIVDPKRISCQQI